MKRGMNLLIITLVLFSLGLVTSQAESCFITDRTSCEASGNIVMGLSDATNTHGELASEGNYNSVLCCSFAGSLTCDGQNKVLGLSSVTNAHAEIPTETTYSNDVCYSDLECISTSLNCGDTAYPLSVLSLSDFSNAHIGAIGDYNINICCTSATLFPGVETPNSFWSSDGTNQILQLNVVVGTTTVKLVLENSGLPEGTQVDFNIWEDDALLDDFIRTISSSVDSNGKAVALWIVTQEDLDKTVDYDEFYFEVNGETSGYLALTFIEAPNCNEIIICSDYSEQNLCENDAELCGVASDSMPVDVDCNDPFIDCSCSWNITLDLCDPDFTVTSLCGDGVVNIGETCDGSNLGPITGCSDFNEFTGGTLDCYSLGTENECRFDTTQCTGGIGPGVCGDGDINTGETCDGSNLGPITGCSNFDEFTGGSLSCDSSCLFDTTQCTGGDDGFDDNDGELVGGIVTGTCTFNSDTTDNCDDGFLSYSWTASWSGAIENKPLECVGGSRTIECPAEIQLPFFGFWNFIAVVLIIAFIYTILILRGRKSN